MTRISKTKDREVTVSPDEGDPSGYAIITEKVRWCTRGNSEEEWWDNHKVYITSEELAAIVAAVEGEKVGSRP